MTKIMLVEDDKSLREIYGVRLLAEGYDIVSAGDGELALAMAIKERPDLIISDVMMPKISGFDMLDILRSTTETRNIKVIMMTALSSEEQRARGEQLGADRYLVKSQVGIEDVVRVVHEVLGDAPGAQRGPAPAVPAASPDAVPAPTPQPQQQPAQAPRREVPPASANTAPQPANVPTMPTPAPQPQQQQPESKESSIPKPTAPFSSPRPASLGERVIQPLKDNPRNQNVDINQLLDKEMAKEAGVNELPQPTTQPAPTAPSTQDTSTPTDSVDATSQFQPSPPVAAPDEPAAAEMLQQPQQEAPAAPQPEPQTPQPQQGVQDINQQLDQLIAQENARTQQPQPQPAQAPVDVMQPPASEPQQSIPQVPPQAQQAPAVPQQPPVAPQPQQMSELQVPPRPQQPQ